MKKLLMIACAVGAGLPLLSYGATYSYVATSGDIRAIEAPTAEIAIATAPDRAVHSGVVLGLIGDTGSVLGASDDALTLYQYVDINGNVRSVEATSVENALALAVDRVHDSGVYQAGAEGNTISQSSNVNL